MALALRAGSAAHIYIRAASPRSLIKLDPPPQRPEAGSWSAPPVIWYGQGISTTSCCQCQWHHWHWQSRSGAEPEGPQVPTTHCYTMLYTCGAELALGHVAASAATNFLFYKTALRQSLTVRQIRSRSLVDQHTRALQNVQSKPLATEKSCRHYHDCRWCARINAHDYTSAWNVVACRIRPIWW